MQTRFKLLKYFTKKGKAQVEDCGRSDVPRNQRTSVSHRHTWGSCR